MNAPLVRREALVGSLLGTAVGDALGMAYEGLSPKRAARLLGPPDRYRLLPGRGLVSDDTEHACLTAQSLLTSGLVVERFTQQLARQLRWWFLALPAGLGMATAKACIKLCVGVPPTRSGVFSAGNGPCMRSPILGAAVDDLVLLREMVRASTRITHLDPKAEYGAWAVALAAWQATRSAQLDPAAYAKQLRDTLADEPSDELCALVDRVVASLARDEATATFAESLGLQRGVSGYVYHTVPVVLHAWFRHPHDYLAAIQTVICCGGDADTTAAIVGGIVGCSVGKAGIPADLLTRFHEWPLTGRWIEQLGQELSGSIDRNTPGKIPGYASYALLPRNLCYLAIVLTHGFRRLLPPY